MTGMQRLMAGLMASLATRGGALGAFGRIGGAVMLQRQGANLGAGTVGFLLPDIMRLGKGLAGLPKRFEAVGDALLVHQGRLREASGVIATAFVRLEAERFARDVRTGIKTGASTDAVARSQSRLEDALEPWNAMATNIENRFMSAIQNGLAFLLEKGNATAAEFVDLLNKVLPDQLDLKNVFKDDPNAKNNDLLANFISDVAGGKYSGRKWKPLKKDEDKKGENK